jgi:hypothetical protein
MKIKEGNSDKVSLNEESTSLQNEIDSMVYDLYEVSDEFRRIINSDMSV